jgi:hypothetical protein
VSDSEGNAVSDEYGHAIGFQVLRRGTPVLSADGVTLGTVRRTSNAVRERIFDGLVIDTPDGQRFLDAPEVERIYERAVLTTFPAADAANHLHRQENRVALLAKNTTTVRQLRRIGQRARDSWERR